MIQPVLIFLSTAALAAETPPVKPDAVRYRQGKEIDFESLLIQGQVKRPELSVVTGDSDASGDGVLRLRENFIEPMTADLSEEIQK